MFTCVNAYFERDSGNGHAAVHTQGMARKPTRQRTRCYYQSNEHAVERAPELLSSSPVLLQPRVMAGDVIKLSYLLAMDMVGSRDNRAECSVLSGSEIMWMQSP